MKDEATGLFAYNISPMDWGWDLLPTVQEHLKRVVDEYYPSEGIASGTTGAVKRVTGFVTSALEAGKRVSWEGDFRNPPRIVVLPQEVEPALALAWKQDNNGVTFVVSEVPLSWLE